VTKRIEIYVVVIEGVDIYLVPKLGWKAQKR